MEVLFVHVRDADAEPSDAWREMTKCPGMKEADEGDAEMLQLREAHKGQRVKAQGLILIVARRRVLEDLDGSDASRKSARSSLNRRMMTAALDENVLVLWVQFGEGCDSKGREGLSKLFER